ncbi:hypothetical protein [Methylobacter tundripaludum]|uniref:Uncharacterized protein n=1 Tax=Methylobacter tundripaludum (strain ATCC BAA-1195 / DSM 17260 / SV96) TaxID=697282 RepID=G3IXC0_METTV|nr:hypothetical protein [Methylobacter tundripaludum]EGW23177.1 hypothetical protein Mettu_2020 [Methylobacter tundripaludum SV96]
MFSALRKFLFIFLAILQLIAPLVHAHAGEKVSDLGLHVPGLEMYGVKHDALMSQAVNYDFNSDGIIVGVDAGMKDGQDNAVVDLDDNHYLHQRSALFKTALSPFDTNFSPQPAQFVCRLLIPSLSPRAPPAQ